MTFDLLEIRELMTGQARKQLQNRAGDNLLQLWWDFAVLYTCFVYSCPVQSRVQS